jgi:hypothetical protein
VYAGDIPIHSAKYKEISTCALGTATLLVYSYTNIFNPLLLEALFYTYQLPTYLYTQKSPKKYIKNCKNTKPATAGAPPQEHRQPDSSEKSIVERDFFSGTQRVPLTAPDRILTVIDINHP